MNSLIETENPVIFFDGVCNLCSNAVQFIIKHDKKKLFRFASLQSEYGQKTLKRFKLSTTTFNSFILYKNGKMYSESTGALLVAKELSGGWPALSALIIIPPLIRDGVYKFISRNRYKWFGKKGACWIPTPDLKSRFLDYN